VNAKQWEDADGMSPAEWQKRSEIYKRNFWEQQIGRLSDPLLPPSSKSRRVFDKPTWTGYEVTLDVWPDVFAWGYLLVPKDIPPGERRPLVVCQHGLDDYPMSVITEDKNDPDNRMYHAYAVRLVEQGFVVFAPHNFYSGKFRLLQRKANPIHLSIYSIILAQHQQLLTWLGTLPFVDAKRIGFYGLSYGGRSAMLIPSLLEGYSLSICAAHFTDWTEKRVTIGDRHGGDYGNQYELFDFNAGFTFNYADLAKLIAPRPFMVERGLRDDASPGRWVDAEYSKVREFYALLGIGDRTTIDHFNGVHEIHGVKSFAFLHQYLKWPIQIH
jgi:hypothetical protein